MAARHTMFERNVARYQRLDDSTAPNVAKAVLASQKQSHKPTDHFSMADAARFESRNQTLTLCKQQISQWIITAILISFVFATIKIYEAKGNMTSGQKSTFQLLITGLSIALGLNSLVSHPTHARQRAWRLISR